MKASRGDVVLLNFPFSDASGSKVRPAIVVQSDVHNRRMNSTIVVFKLGSPEGRAAGLHFDSAVACTNLYTVHEDFIQYRIGKLLTSLLPTLDACLRAALGIS